jgi:hypothetical protein
MFTGANATAILTGLASFLTLIFYGTSFEVTPFQLIAALFSPFRLALKLFPHRYAVPPEDTADKASADVVETTGEHSDAQPDLGAEVEPEQRPIAATEVLPDSEIATTDEIEPAELMRELSERATYFANKLERRTNTYMILGVAIGAMGLFVWAWKLSAVSNLLTLTALAQELLPRVTILVFIELLAGFFLRQYRVGIEDFKYFFDIEQRARWKGVAYAIAKDSRDKNLLKQVALSLGDNLATPVLKKGETTGTLEAMRVESNPALEALKLVTETAKDAIGKFGKGRPTV